MTSFNWYIQVHFLTVWSSFIISFFIFIDWKHQIHLESMCEFLFCLQHFYNMILRLLILCILFHRHINTACISTYTHIYIYTVYNFTQRSLSFIPLFYIVICDLMIVNHNGLWLLLKKAVSEWPVIENEKIIITYTDQSRWTGCIFR